MVRIGINGFGRMGRLSLRRAFNHPNFKFVVINEPHATAETMATLLEFDTVQGRWDTTCSATDNSRKMIRSSSIRNAKPAELSQHAFGEK